VRIYLDGSTVDECRDLLRRGVGLEILAGRLRIRPEELAKLLGLAADQSRGRAAAAGDDDVDLWAGEQLQGVL
jgi:hypothetical protein